MDNDVAGTGTDDTDVDRLLAYVDQLGLQPRATVRLWGHMGAVICDAGLQAGINYTTVVLPRLRRLVERWPEATTTSVFRGRLATDDLGAVLDWHGKKLAVIASIAECLASADIETTAHLAAAYADDQAAAALAGLLRQVNGVGHKTVDYLAILVGSDQHVAVDQHLRAFAREAGIVELSYGRLRSLYTAVAIRRGWTAGQLDRAVWLYQTEKRRHG